MPVSPASIRGRTAQLLLLRFHYHLPTFHPTSRSIISQTSANSPPYFTMRARDESMPGPPERPATPPPPTPSGPLSFLDEEHQRTFRRALLNILSTDLAESTYAQIIDGLPTTKSLRYSWSSVKDHPVHVLDHSEVCDGSLEKARSLRSNIDLSLFRFEDKVSHQDLPFGCSC